MVTYTWDQIGIAEITKLFLYGSLDVPTNLVDESLIRPSNDTTSIDMDAATFMSTGPGRFAQPHLSSLVSGFLTGSNPLFAGTGTRQELTKANVVSALGLVGANNIDFRLQAYNYQDAQGSADFYARSYIYNSQWFEVSANAVFVIEADGSKHIEDLSFTPRPDNFDFDSDSLAGQIANSGLQPAIDPSNIGRQVVINFVNKDNVPVFDDYDIDDYVLASTKQEFGLPPFVNTVTAFASLAAHFPTLTDALWDADITQFLDADNRAILYGTNGNDTKGDLTFDLTPIIGTYLYTYAETNGVVILGGKGNDTLYATENDDKIYGGDDNDTLIGGDGNDSLDGGGGTDTISYDYITSGGVRVDIGEGESEAGSTDHDTFTNIEKIVGSSQVDTVKSISEVEGKITKITSGDDSLGQYLEIHAPGMSSAGVKAYAFEKLELGDGNNVIKLNLSGDSTLQEISIDSPTGTGRNEIDITGGQPGHTGLNIYLAAGNDVIRNAPAGSRIQTGDGNDIIQLMDKVLITDASNTDKLYYTEAELHGGIRAKNSDSVYAYDTNGIRYGIDTDNELQVIDRLDNTLYVANYVPSMAGISLFEVQYGAYQLLKGPGDFGKSNNIFEVMGLQIKALTGENPFDHTDPIVLDLDGDGLELTARTSVSQLFDLDANQFAVTSGWVRGDDGFLARDLNSNGIIDDGSELVGNRTMEGFDALALLDTNSDGHITSADSTFASFRIWRDLNGNGVTDSGELQTLTEAGITSIDVAATNTTETDNAGNRILGTASFTRSDSSTGTVAANDNTVCPALAA